MGTFADLMSLLMCFFVLLLSFSEMDVLKFKQIAGSMKFAFGVQNKIEVKDIPKGTSVIAMEFRPGRPEPTPIDTIQQQTTDMTQEMLEFQAGNEDSAGGRQKQRGEQRGGSAQQTATEQQSSSTTQAASQEEVAERMRKIAQQLEKQIVDGAIEMESLGQQITIRIRENGSFSAGSAFLQPQFVPILRQIGSLLADMPGDVEVSGHSDSQQISNELYRSNWDLSSQRAVAVAEELRRATGFDESRMSVVGKADTAPLIDIDDIQGRSRNRRVEISINQGKPKISDPISVLEGS
jgi:chemotaxis protein MotB